MEATIRRYNPGARLLDRLHHVWCPACSVSLPIAIERSEAYEFYLRKADLLASSGWITLVGERGSLTTVEPRCHGFAPRDPANWLV